jgi:hypothetical protein
MINLIRSWLLPKPPPLTDEMKHNDLVWRAIWVKACATCGGNCGQCGLTGKLGNVPADMDNLIRSLEKLK